MEVETKDAKIEVDNRRWAILALLSIIGMLVMIMTVLSGTVSGILKEQFNLKVEDVDWIFISNAGTSVIFGFPLGLVARMYSLEVKKWLLTNLLLLICSYAFISISMLDKRAFFFVYIAQILCGCAFSIFVVLVGISCVGWFPENEQATVFGVAYGSCSVGNLLGALIPIMVLSPSLYSKITDVVFVLTRIYIGMGLFVLFITILVWIYIPSLPPSSPSHLEKIRRIRAVTETNSSFRIVSIRYKLEWKDIMTDCVSQALILSYSISISILYVYFMMIPTLPIVSDSSNPLISSAKKARYLTCFAGGGAVASIVFGLLQDKVKSYRPLAFGLALTNVIFAVAQNIAYFERCEACLYIFVGLQGTTVMSSLSFTSEVLKQNSYPKVSEGTQAIVISIICDAWFLLFVIIFRSGISAFGDICFYVITAISCFIEAILLLCINPSLNRFVAENDEMPLLGASEQI